ncbi:hypothetical protein AB0D57_36650 [Streptomyces sp. NPDC048275]|uniref:hypothetical protein n=1 Tax=Streptomyces sp. NPDC048275 TaxID=3155629 RepID=UPI003403A16B
MVAREPSTSKGSLPAALWSAVIDLVVQGEAVAEASYGVWNCSGEQPVLARSAAQVPSGTFDADVVCRLPDRLTGRFDRWVHIVVDGLAAHRSRKIGTWLADHPECVELHFLPS